MNFSDLHFLSRVKPSKYEKVIFIDNAKWNPENEATHIRK